MQYAIKPKVKIAQSPKNHPKNLFAKTSKALEIGIRIICLTASRIKIMQASRINPKNINSHPIMNKNATDSLPIGSKESNQLVIIGSYVPRWLGALLFGAKSSHCWFSINSVIMNNSFKNPPRVFGVRGFLRSQREK